MRKILFILGELTNNDVEWLMLSGRKEQVSAGTRLVQEGYPIDAFYIVLSGEFRVIVESQNGREIALLKSGEVLGEISFLDTRPPVATAIATQDSLVFTIPGQVLSHKLKDDGPFAAHFYRAIAMFLADRMRNTVGLLGYGQEYPPDSPMQLVHDLSPKVIENLPLARERLALIVKRLRGY
jgi:CRP/FNR family transcriptional regulator, cyclic AMP receptor protein